MFYHPEVLQRRSGCFGTIWLAATCSSRLLRREALAVDVPRTCAALLCFVLGSAPPPGSLAPPPAPGAPPPRCSLYLAALLQLGLARVYGTQCQHSAEEAAQVLERLNRAQPPPNIDLSPPRRPQLLPDARALMATLELAPDPFFGVMAPPLPSPSDLLQLPRLEEELPPMELPPLALTVSPESITLREPEPPKLPALEEELPEVTPLELQLLSEAEAELLPAVEEVAEVPEVQPPRPLALPVPEEPGVLPLPPEVPRRRRAPRLPHRDPQPQVTRAEFRALLLQPHAHCQPLVIPEPPPLRRRPPAELFQTPTIGWLPPELGELWGRGARPGPVELPSEVEVPREALEPSLAVLPSSEVSLETTEEEPRPRPRPLAPPEERRVTLAPPPAAIAELPELLEPELPSLAEPDLRRLLLEGAGRPEGAELLGLLPPAPPRALVARLFRVALELCAAGWLRLVQPRPFAPIGLRPPRE